MRIGSRSATRPAIGGTTDFYPPRSPGPGSGTVATVAEPGRPRMAAIFKAVNPLRAAQSGQLPEIGDHRTAARITIARRPRR
jgi:hypothetical protein